jgi:hypothetical protein
MNEEIERLFRNFRINNENIPVDFLNYDGNATKYITYMENYKDNSLSGDDELVAYVSYYDFDIYVKRGTGSYFPIIDAINDILVANGWTRQLTRESPDNYEKDTGYYHKTLCFAKEREV